MGSGERTLSAAERFGGVAEFYPAITLLSRGCGALPESLKGNAAHFYTRARAKLTWIGAAAPRSRLPKVQLEG